MKLLKVCVIIIHIISCLHHTVLLSMKKDEKTLSRQIPDSEYPLRDALKRRDSVDSIRRLLHGKHIIHAWYADKDDFCREIECANPGDHELLEVLGNSRNNAEAYFHMWGLVNKNNIVTMFNGGECALNVAINEGCDPAVLILLLDIGVRRECCRNGNADSTLHLASGPGTLAMLRILLQYKFTDRSIVNNIDIYGHSPLHTCIRHLDEQLIEYLGEYEKEDLGEHVDEQTFVPGKMLILIDEYVAKIILLVSHGADIDLRDRIGKTPLHYAVGLYCGRYDDRNTSEWYPGIDKIIEILIVLGANIRLKDDSGKTPLDYGDGTCIVTSMTHVHGYPIFSKKLQEVMTKALLKRMSYEMNFTRHKQRAVKILHTQHYIPIDCVALTMSYRDVQAFCLDSVQQDGEAEYWMGGLAQDMKKLTITEAEEPARPPLPVPVTPEKLRDYPDRETLQASMRSLEVSLDKAFQELSTVA